MLISTYILDMIVVLLAQRRVQLGGFFSNPWDRFFFVLRRNCAHWYFCDTTEHICVTVRVLQPDTKKLWLTVHSCDVLQSQLCHSRRSTIYGMRCDHNCATVSTVYYFSHFRNEIESAVANTDTYRSFSTASLSSQGFALIGVQSDDDFFIHSNEQRESL